MGALPAERRQITVCFAISSKRTSFRRTIPKIWRRSLLRSMAAALRLSSGLAECWRHSPGVAFWLISAFPWRRKTMPSGPSGQA